MRSVVFTKRDAVLMWVVEKIQPQKIIAIVGYRIRISIVGTHSTDNEIRIDM
jgi:hypothetical protein